MKVKNLVLTKGNKGFYFDNIKRMYIGFPEESCAYLLEGKAINRGKVFQDKWITTLGVFLLIGFVINWYAAIAGAVVYWIVLTIVYRKCFLPSLEKIEGVQFNEGTSKLDDLKGRSYLMLWITMLAGLAMVFIMIYSTRKTLTSLEFSYLLEDEKRIILLIGTIVLTVLGLYTTAIFAKAIWLKRKEAN